MKLLQNPYVVGVLVILAVAMVFRNSLGTLWHKVFSSKPTAAATATASAAKPGQKASPDNQQQPPLVVPDKNIELDQVGWVDVPRRNPFRPLGGLWPAAAARAPTGPASGILSLNAIWWQTDSALAVINGEVVGKGETIQGFVIEDIVADGVWVSGAQGRELLRIGFGIESPASMETETNNNRGSATGARNEGAQ